MPNDLSSVEQRPRQQPAPGTWRVSHQTGDGLPGFEGLVGVVGPEQTNSRGRKFTRYIAQYIAPENADLIAALPELLDACQTVEQWMLARQPGPFFDQVVLDVVTKAIAKAKGESK